MTRAGIVSAGLITIICSTPALAQPPTPQAGPPQAGPPQPGPSAAELARQLNNPVASLVSVPLQFNWDQQVGIDDDTRTTINFQPVVPFGLNDRWNLILRWIMPYVAQPRLTEEGLPSSGVSDIVASIFLSPARPGRFIWGAGPVFVLPTSSDPVLGGGKWGLGPTAVVLKQVGGWTFGGLFNHVWSIAGDDFTGGVPRADLNSTFLQPFVSYTTANVITYTVNLEASANWNADGDTWTVPLHLQVTKLTRFGPYPFSIGVGVAPFLTAPNDEPDFRLRFIATVLLPRAQ